jgi:hypothetical protein
MGHLLSTWQGSKHTIAPHTASYMYVSSANRQGVSIAIIIWQWQQLATSYVYVVRALDPHEHIIV